MNSQDTESGEHDRKSAENVFQCLIVWLSCLFILKNQALIFFPSQLISHNLQFSNTKRIQLQKDHSSLGQGISDFPSRIGKSHIGLWGAQQRDWADQPDTGLKRGAAPCPPHTTCSAAQQTQQTTQNKIPTLYDLY